MTENTNIPNDASPASGASVLIVGAGIAGLAAGIYARQSGFAVTILESHSIPGGASTSWKRKGYLFEGGMHWLTGSSPRTNLNALWREVGALDDETTIHVRDPFLVFSDGDKTASLYRDVDRLRAHLIELAPEDEREITRLCKDIARFTAVDMPIDDLKGVKLHHKVKAGSHSMLSMLPAFARMPFYSKQTTLEFAQRFKSPLIRSILVGTVGEEMAATALLFTLATLASGDGGYPEGGSLGMARRMAEKFEQLGGTIRYKTRVERIIVKNGRVVGIDTDQGRFDADAVIVTQDTRVAIDTLFDKPIEEPWAQRMRETTVPLANIFVSFGVRADLTGIPETVAFTLPEAIECAGITYDAISFNNYATYPGYAPAGCTAVTVLLSGDSYEWWQSRREAGAYDAEKEQLAHQVAEALAVRYPQITENIEVWDVATPLTYERYLHSYHGSWMSNMNVGGSMKPYPIKSETTVGLYFAGQRITPPGGLPTALDTGRTAVQHLCRDTDTVFQGAL